MFSRSLLVLLVHGFLATTILAENSNHSKMPASRALQKVGLADILSEASHEYDRAGMTKQSQALKLLAGKMRANRGIVKSGPIALDILLGSLNSADLPSQSLVLDAISKASGRYPKEVSAILNSAIFQQAQKNLPVKDTRTKETTTMIPIYKFDSEKERIYFAGNRPAPLNSKGKEILPKYGFVRVWKKAQNKQGGSYVEHMTDRNGRVHSYRVQRSDTFRGDLAGLSKNVWFVHDPSNKQYPYRLRRFQPGSKYALKDVEKFKDQLPKDKHEPIFGEDGEPATIIEIAKAFDLDAMDIDYLWRDPATNEFVLVAEGKNGEPGTVVRQKSEGGRLRLYRYQLLEPGPYTDSQVQGQHFLAIPKGKNASRYLVKARAWVVRDEAGNLLKLAEEQKSRRAVGKARFSPFYDWTLAPVSAPMQPKSKMTLNKTKMPTPKKKSQMTKNKSRKVDPAKHFPFVTFGSAFTRFLPISNWFVNLAQKRSEHSHGTTKGAGKSKTLSSAVKNKTKSNSKKKVDPLASFLDGNAGSTKSTKKRFQISTSKSNKGSTPRGAGKGAKAPKKKIIPKKKIVPRNPLDKRTNKTATLIFKYKNVGVGSKAKFLSMTKVALDKNGKEIIPRNTLVFRWKKGWHYYPGGRQYLSAGYYMFRTDSNGRLGAAYSNRTIFDGRSIGLTQRTYFSNGHFYPQRNVNRPQQTTRYYYPRRYYYPGYYYYPPGPRYYYYYR